MIPMFQKNTAHEKVSLFSFINQLSKGKRKKLEKTKEYHFYKMIYSQIPEEDFSILYSKKGSRPNAPINSMVSALLLYTAKGWSYEELFGHIDFDLRTRTALGLTEIEDSPFCAASLFNFQNRLIKYHQKTGINLFEKVFDQLTAAQLRSLKIKTSIQRSDSFLAASNIRKYGRTQLLIEVIVRLSRILTKKDLERVKNQIRDYIQQGSSQYVYGLKRSEIPHEMKKLSGIYTYLYSTLKETYQDTAVFGMFEQVYQEHFRKNDDGNSESIPLDELGSSIVQSPDDLDATYRKKKAQESRGQSVNITETAHPDNPLNLITDVAIEPNNIDDSQILNRRLEKIKEKTPDLEELHTDGAYGSRANDQKMEKLGITHIQTAVRGRAKAVDLTIIQTSTGQFQVQCPHQLIPANPTPKRFKACFDNSICSVCPYAKQCPSRIQKTNRTWYFTHDQYVAQQRNKNIENIPIYRRKIRPNVEASVQEFKGKFHQKKLKVRGAFKTALFMFSAAISINFGRLFRAILSDPFLTTHSIAVRDFLLSFAAQFYIVLKHFMTHLRLSSRSVFNMSFF